LSFFRDYNSNGRVCVLHIQGYWFKSN